MTKKAIGTKLKQEKLEIKTEVKYLSISPRKLRLVAKAIKKLPLGEALRKLKFLEKRGALILAKALKTILADAEHNYGLKKDSLILKEVLVNEGPRFKKRDFFHGARFDGGIIQKKKSHLIIKAVGIKENGT